MSHHPSLLTLLLFAVGVFTAGNVADHVLPSIDVRPTAPDPDGRCLHMKSGVIGEDFAFQIFSIKEILPLPALNAVLVRQHNGTVTVFSIPGFSHVVKDGESYHVAFNGETLHCSIFHTTVPGVPWVRVAGSYNRGNVAAFDALLRAAMVAYPPKVMGP